MHARRTLVVLALVALALCTPGAAVAAQTYNDTISGYEYYATSTDGKFAGNASGALPGYWKTDVQHTALCVSCPSTATITGGSFSLATTLNGSSTLVTGKLTGGTVKVTDVGADCSNQTFDVEGVLGSVGPWYSGTGTGTFSAVLTHHRHWLFGSCITYSASVEGAISSTF
jgi:hypothetical protein